ncbi:carotenoid biosynthesis protein [Nocardia blacklockiae]|uniref:carotenoid biosynthesis protein n=1 Tax=Nocardia blacklockiae TaxID=480036 RepID=UPI001895F756|nr:carotenoid biosynthesis protein [Nocardia blacklockiae]MBF6174133.1 carotenoid biosynthesis protein [Nocardia blacklockiae]
MTARRAPVVAALALILTQIAYPLTAGVARDRITVAIVLLSAATALTHAALTRGPRFAAGFLVIVSGLGLAAEIAGTATGFPFGCYRYAHGGLGPALAEVPLVVPLAWTGGLYPVWVVVRRLTPLVAVRIPLTALGAVGWDLFLDPQMVADGRWTWCSAHPGLPGVPQIPYTNYLGWFAVASVMAALLELLGRRYAATVDTLAVPVAVFLWTWLGSALAHVAFLGLPVSGGYGLLGLGVLGIPLLATMFRDRPAARGHCPGICGTPRDP